MPEISLSCGNAVTSITIKQLLLKGLFLFFLFTAICMHINAQDTSRHYSISICGKPQYLHLIELNNGNVQGFVEVIFDKRKKLKSYKSNEIRIKTPLSEPEVAALYDKLDSAGINSLKQCQEDMECKEIDFLHADFLIIDLTHQHEKKHFEYQAIHPINKENSNIEKTQLRKKIQEIISMVGSEISLERKYSDVVKNLKDGYYCYFEGISFACIIKKKKK